MSKIKGQEKSGVLIIVLISMIVAKGKIFWSKTKRDIPNIKMWILLIESILCFEQWVYLPEFNKCDVLLYEKQIRNLMKLCKVVINRQLGNGLNIPKFHGMLHHVWNLKRHGAFTNFDTTSLESNLKENGKYPASTAVKGAEVFQEQLGSRMTDSIVIDTICRKYIPDLYGAYKSCTIDPNVETVNGTSPIINRCATRFGMKVDTNSIKFDNIGIHKNFPSKNMTCILKLFSTGDYSCLTEIKIGDDLFRGHYCYRGKSSWNDYAFFQWNSVRHLVPGRIEFFLNIDTDENRMKVGVDTCGVYALIQSCIDDVSQFVEGSKMVKKSYLETDTDGENVYRLICVNSISSTCFAIPNIGSTNDKEILILQPPSTWGDIFVHRKYKC